jgi:hypothetical protein
MLNVTLHGAYFIISIMSACILFAFIVLLHFDRC